MAKVADLGSALNFLELFPECEAWEGLVLDHEKKRLRGAPNMSTSSLRRELSGWLALPNVHVFVRPMLGNLVFVDLDGFFNHNKNLNQVLHLRPRAVVKTSPGNFQAWFTLPTSLATQHALKVSAELTALFQADTCSVKTGQPGRIPGSLNAKPGKGNLVELVHGCLQDLDEKEYLSQVPRQKVSLQGGEFHVAPRGSVQKTTEDRSGQDWKMCCSFFESHSEQTEELAFGALHGKFSKCRPDSKVLFFVAK